jgi:lantibiotic biosynthesis protein
MQGSAERDGRDVHAVTDRLGLSSATRARMLDAITDIAKVLERPPDPYDGDKLLRASLLSGHAGYAVTLAYLDRWAPSARWRRIAARHLESAMDVVPEIARRPFFSYGFTGTGWAVQHLARWFIEVPDDALDDIDLAVLALVEDAVTISFDLQHGLVGFGLYALERLPSPIGKRMLVAIIDRLARMAESRPRGGLAWRVINAAWTEGPGALSTKTIYEPGILNGAAGVVGVLGGAIAAGIEPTAAKRLLDGAATWTWSQLRHVSRTSWTNGALGIAAVTLAAARAAELERWQDRALVLARKIAREAPRVVESGIAEGVAGTTYMFYRLYVDTGERVFADAACTFLHRLLRRRRAPEVGLAGFRRFSRAWQRGYLRDPEFPIGWTGSPSIIFGVAGIGLVLASILSGTAELDWDRPLLLSHRTLQPMSAEPARLQGLHG